jgi:S-adenosylmethionine decarboxylase proenzyme
LQSFYTYIKFTKKNFLKQDKKIKFYDKIYYIMRALGKHLIVELYGCDSRLISDVDYVQDVMMLCAKEANTTIIDSLFHGFKPYGVSGVIVVQESHLSIHTWPEHKFASVDFFTCGDHSDPWKAFKTVKKKFKSKYFSIMKMERGVLLDE